MPNSNFYKNLPYLESLSDVSNIKKFKDVPMDWIVLATDVQGSTIAVESGKYKEVNLIAAACVTAILNIDEDLEIPFVYGGDGASILIPPHILEEAKDVLRDTQNFAKLQFDLNLRIGAVPVIDILRDKQLIKIAKLKVSDNYYQSIFWGGGMDYAEVLLKSDERYNIDFMPPKFRANYDGLRCVWQDIPSRKDEVVSILVKATSMYRSHMVIYQEVMDKIQEIYGDKESRYPIQVSNIRLKNNFQKTYLESLIQSYQYKTNKYKTIAQNLVGAYRDQIGGYVSSAMNKINDKVFKQTISSD